MRLFFFQNCLSPHQLPYIKALASADVVEEVMIITPRKTYEDRAAMGWQAESVGVPVMLAPSDESVCSILKEAMIKGGRVVCLFSGIRADVDVFRWLKLSLNYKVQRAIITEAPFVFDKPLWMHRLRFALQDWMFVPKIDYMFAIGPDCVTYYRSWSRRWKVVPFLYCAWHDGVLVSAPEDDLLHIAYVGSLSERKHVDLIVSALTEMQRNLSMRCRVTIVGDGPMRAALEAQVDAAHLIDIVTFSGTVAMDEIGSVLQKQDMLMLPSRYDGWGAVINEALEQGVFAVCSDKCGARQLLCEPWLGRVIKAEQQSEWTRVLSYAVENLKILRSDKLKRRLWAEKHISGQAVAQRMLEALEPKVRKKRVVLQFVPSLAVKDGGTTTYMSQLTPILGTWVDLHVCCCRPRVEAETLVDLPGATIHTIDGDLRHLSQMKQDWLAVLDDIKPDVLHVNCCWMPQCAWVQHWFEHWYRMERAMTDGNDRQTWNSDRYPVALTPHGMLEPWILHRNFWTRKLPALCLYQRRAVRRAAVVIATAEEEKTHLESLHWNNNIKVIANGVAVDDITLKSDWTLSHQFLFMSRIHPKKGLELLIDIVAAWRDDTTGKMARLMALGWHCVIAGEGDAGYIAELKALCEKRHIQQWVQFIGPVYGDAKWQLIQQSDVVILPSYSENFGLIVAEALASGTPVVTTTGTPWRALNDKKCGWWVSADKVALADALANAMSLDAETLKSMGLRGRKLIEDKYSASSVAKGLLCVYDELCERVDMKTEKP